MVAGQPVSVQSPARNKRGMEVCCRGRQRSTPGSGENVAAASLMTVAFNNSSLRAAALLHAFREEFRERGVGHGEEVGVGGFCGRVVKGNSGELATFHFQAANWGA